MSKCAKWIALILSAVCLAGCGKELPPAPELMEPVGVQVDMAAAYVGEIYTTATYSAAVTAYVEALSFPVDGVVKNVPVYSGKTVEAGDVLVELDLSAVESKVKKLRQSIAYAEQDNAYSDRLAELDIRILEAELRQLEDSGAEATEIALKELDIEEKRTQLKQTKQLRQPGLSAQRRELAALEAALEDTCLRAPFAGRVLYSGVKEGDGVSAYKPVMWLVDDSRLSLSGEYIAEPTLLSADRLYARIGGEDYTIRPLPVDQTEYASKVLSGEEVKSEYEILGSTDALSRLEAGQYAAVCLVTRYVSEALLVPAGAIHRDGNGQYVYVDADGKRERRSVKVGVTTDALAQITEGLEEGEIVYVKD